MREKSGETGRRMKNEFGLLHRNCEVRNVSCFKLLNLWYFVHQWWNTKSMCLMSVSSVKTLKSGTISVLYC